MTYLIVEVFRLHGCHLVCCANRAVLLVNAMCKKVCGRQVQILVLDTQDSNGMFRSYLGVSKAAQSVGCLDILDARWLTISSIGPMVPFSKMH